MKKKGIEQVKPPAWCHGRSAEIFSEIMGDLTKSGINHADIRTVAVLADMQTRYEQCHTLAADPDRSDYYVNRHGDECEAPYITRLAALAREMLPYFRQLGMTPAARKSMQLPAPTDNIESNAALGKFNLKKVS